MHCKLSLKCTESAMECVQQKLPVPLKYHPVEIVTWSSASLDTPLEAATGSHG